MGTLDRTTGSVKKEIKIVDVSGKTATQIEDAFNNNYGNVGWRIIQVVVLANKPYVIAEREV